ncbi:hypothetical protein NIES2101_14265 [Calothrix sp. HK-06]|nr:hypothetical protein NIES2101_14265 [Calothrix sp. HK-06]
MHLVRWLLAVGWLSLIFSLFFPQLSSWLTEPINLSSPFHLRPEKCVFLQGVCLKQPPYGMGASMFWGVILPIIIVVLLVAGHEFWRRVCPLYFFSQIPRALGIQRKQKITTDTGSVRYELVGVEKESWLGRNYLYLQIGLFYLGLNVRILFVNGAHKVMGVYLLFVIAAAISVGFLFKGRSWCQYFCPMAPVQMFYTGPRGLLGSDAHLQPPQSVTQSMCRSTDSSGKEKIACVSCQSPCIDIDVERSYWEGITRPDQKLLFYSYFGLMFGFYMYFFLYAGNWDYYYSGAWSHEEGLLYDLGRPGFYIFNHPIPIPKIIASPLTTAVFAAGSYFICLCLEKLYRYYLKRQNKYLNEEQVLHVIFVLSTFVSFNVFFIFAGRSNMNRLPGWMILFINTLIVFVSSTWLYRSLSRSKEKYDRESLAGSLRRQLNKLAVDWSQFLEGRSLQNLLPDEIYILGKVLPKFNLREKLEVYKGILQENLQEGKVHSVDSLQLLKDMRQQLNVSNEEHYSVLRELGVEEPELLDPNKQLSRENKLRLESYHRGLELLIQDLINSGIPLKEAINCKQNQIIALKQEYAITASEHEKVLAEMFNKHGLLLRTASILLSQLQSLAVREQILRNNVPSKAPVYALLTSSLISKQKLITTQLLKILEILGDGHEAFDIAQDTGVLAAAIITEFLKSNDEHSNWAQRLSPRIIAALRQQLKDIVIIAHNLPTQINSIEPTVMPIGKKTPYSQEVIDVLVDMLNDLDPLVQASSLYALHNLQPSLGFQHANKIMNLQVSTDSLLIETAQKILGNSANQEENTLVFVPTLTVQKQIMGKIERLVFQQPIVRVGRESNNDIVILDGRVSPQHGIFYIDKTGVKVKDLGSINGLRIGKEEIHDAEVQLQQKDIVYFSSGNDLAIGVQWEMQKLQGDTIIESFGTLEKLLWLYPTSLFSSLKTDTLIELAKNSTVKVYIPQQQICSIGSPAQELIVLINGEAKVTSKEANTPDTYLKTILPGQTIGELEVLTHKNYTATIIASGHRVRALTINASNLERLISQNPSIAQNLLQMVSSHFISNTTR